MTLYALYSNGYKPLSLTGSSCLLIDIDTRPSTIIVSLDVTPPAAWITPPPAQSAVWSTSTRRLGQWRNTSGFLQSGTCSGYRFSWYIGAYPSIYPVIDGSEPYWRIDIRTYGNTNPRDSSIEQRITWRSNKLWTTSDAKITGTYSDFEQIECRIGLDPPITPPIANPFFTLNSATIALPS